MMKDPLRNHIRSANKQGAETTDEFPRARRLDKKRRAQKLRAGDESGFGDAQDMSAPVDDTQDDLRTHVDNRVTSRDDPFTEK